MIYELLDSLLELLLQGYSGQLVSQREILLEGLGSYSLHLDAINLMGEVMLADKLWRRRALRSLPAFL